MNDAELVEQMAAVIAQQADIIRRLHGTVRQLDAVTSLDEEIAANQNRARELVDGNTRE